jgi:hypothetical protein
MRLSTLHAGLVVTAAAIALSACAAQQPMVPSSAAVSSAVSSDGSLAPQVEPGVTTCATSPPQFAWIFKGACAKFTLKPAGAPFSLQQYQNITIKGSIGKNNVSGSATLYAVDATGSGDIDKYGGKSFPLYKARGKTFIYAVAINESKQTIKPIAEKGKPILQYVITDSKGLPGKSCGAAVLVQGAKGSFLWESLPTQAKVSGNTVTISQYTVPHGFDLPPQTPLYFGVNCF